MSVSSPFAYGPSGRWLTSTHEHEVFICDGEDDHTVHIVALDAPVVGVRNSPSRVLALDAQGALRGINPQSGETSWTISIGGGAVALASAGTGRWAVVHDGAVAIGTDDTLARQVALPGARFARFDPSGQVLGVVTEDGQLFTITADGPAIAGPTLGFAATGLAHSRLGWWLVSTTRGVFRVPVDGGDPELYLKWGGDDPPMRVACSANGRLCAFTTEDKAVVLFGVETDTNCGAIIYADRTVGELEFGPGGWLGIGLGLGDGNKIDLLSGACHRTDPPDDRTRNRWMVQLGFDSDEIGGVFGTAGKDAAATPSADARTQWGADTSEAAESGPPSAGMLVYAIGLVAVAGFLTYSAVAGWYDDPMWAWLGAFILGVSGIAILVSRRNP